MKIFLDTASLEDIRSCAATGLIDGVTTNPTLLSQQKGSFKEAIAEICEIVKGPVSVEVVAESCKDMLQQAHDLIKISPHVAIKVPLTQEGLKACKALTQEGTQVNVTLCFSLIQAVLAAKAGATYISPFVGRLDDIGTEGQELLYQIREAYDQYDMTTQILAASLRHPQHVMQAILAGADVITVPPKVFHQLLHHPLTEKGIQIFEGDWKKTVGF